MKKRVLAVSSGQAASYCSATEKKCSLSKSRIAVNGLRTLISEVAFDLQCENGQCRCIVQSD